ncbi:hypothetical protein [Bradyrhizobium sp. URHD0069]|uniref:hypothetical protein n=1 Tax=Bradyrhizobium sp. URHD0069 TaxID=1380355 RepID=UPI0012DDDF97|nr:hypothetical protein [Bradyrhizobium sp. URHD0069]
MFCFLETFDIVGRRVSTSDGDDRITNLSPPRPDIVVQDHRATNLGSQVNEPQQRLSDRIKNDPAKKGDRDGS